MECQQFAVLHYQQSLGCMVIFFRSESIGDLYRQKAMRLACFPAPEMSVNRASTISVHASWIIERLSNDPNS